MNCISCEESKKCPKAKLSASCDQRVAYGRKIKPKKEKVVYPINITNKHEVNYYE